MAFTPQRYGQRFAPQGQQPMRKPMSRPINQISPRQTAPTFRPVTQDTRPLPTQQLPQLPTPVSFAQDRLTQSPTRDQLVQPMGAPIDQMQRAQQMEAIKAQQSAQAQPFNRPTLLRPRG